MGTRSRALALLALLIAGCATATGSPGRCLGDGAGLAAVRDHLGAEEPNGFRGAVAIELGEEQLSWASVGYDAGQTHFWIASISKAVTATAAVRLAQQGQLDLDVQIGQLFPSAPEPLAQRTLAQVLGHRAGLGDHSGIADAIADRDVAVQAILARGVEHDGFFYSNDGFTLAAAMMERATGRPYEDLVRQQVLVPLGMNHSGFWGDPIELSRFAAFRPRDIRGAMRGGQPVRTYGYMGATGLYSTAADMLAFLRGVQSDAFLSPEMRAQMWTPGWPQAADGAPRSGVSYGLGWVLDVEQGHVMTIRHGGHESNLHNGEIQLSADGGFELVVLAQDDFGEDRTWSDRIKEGVLDCLAR